MKLALLAIAAVMLTGCAGIPTYDPNEYALANSISTISDITQKYCTTDRTKVGRNVEALYINAAMLKNYAAYRPDNEEIAKLISQFGPIIDEFYNKVEQGIEYSNVYCVTKLQIINTTSTSIQEVIGNKPK